MFGFFCKKIKKKIDINLREVYSNEAVKKNST